MKTAFLLPRGLSLIAVLAVAGCGDFNLFQRAEPEPTTVIAAVDARPEVLSVEDVPEGSLELAAAVSEGDTAEGDPVNGLTVTSLGDATIPGMWMETPLVDRERPGRVVGTNGEVIEVILRPSGGSRGSGSRMSISAFQALGIPLTALPTLTVIAD